MMADFSAVNRSCVRQNAGLSRPAFWRTQLQRTFMSGCLDRESIRKDVDLLAAGGVRSHINKSA